MVIWNRTLMSKNHHCKNQLLKQDMDHPKKELLKTIEEQKEKIGKYQSKLSDIVSAYKTLQKEKDLLQKSLQALGDSNAISDEQTKPGTNAAANNEESASDSQSEDGGSIDGKAGRQSLKQQIATLSASLSAITKEKSKMEASFQADKKRLRIEYEEKEDLLQAEVEELKTENEQLKKDVNEWRSRVRETQVEREKDESNHAVMMRELQQLLASERTNKESIEQQLDDLRAECEHQMKQQQCQQQLSSRRLENDIASLNKALAASKKIEALPPGENKEIQELKKQLKIVNEEHVQAIEHEQLLARHLQDQLAAQSKEYEDRTGALEAQLAQLAEAMGEAERLRTQEHQAKVKVQQRLTQLEQENTALLETAAKQTSGVAPQDEDSDEFPSELPDVVETFNKVKQKLLELNSISTNPVDIPELLQDVELHTSCQRELNIVREEFERYKLRAQSVLKHNKSSKAQEHRNTEVQSLRTQLNELREKLWQVRSEKDKMDEDFRRKEEINIKAMESLRESHKTELHSVEEAHREKEVELNAEMKRHRERTIALLAEKDAEIESLKGRVEDIYPALGTAQEAGASSEEQAITELLSRAATLTPRSSDAALLHFAQEQARKDVEIASLRRQKHFLDSSVRETQQNAAQKEGQLMDQMQLLKEEVRRLQRSISRESANLEYLKNVVFKYMVCTDLGGQLQMLNAIATILQFSPQEKDTVRQHLHSGWWSAFRKTSHT